MREVELTAGERTKILGLMTRNLRARVIFEVETRDGSPVSGTIQTEHGSVITGRKVATIPLQPLNTFDKPWNQHGYQIFVTPDTDAVVRFHTRHIRDVHIYGAMAVMTGVAVIGGLVAWAVGRG